METKMKKVKIITIILAIILVTLVAFGGVYIKTQNRIENKVKDYQFGRELSSGRIVEIKVVTSEESKPNPEDLTSENYNIVKNTIEKRLKNLGAQDYTISLNEQDGTIRVELAEDENTDTYVYFMTADGKAQIKEKDTGIELLSDSMVKKALYTYTTDVEGKYQVFMELHLTEEGQAKIEEIKNNYAIYAEEVEEIEKAQEAAKKEEAKEGEVTEETKEETTAENTRKIAQLIIAGNEYDIEKVEKNKIKVMIGDKTTNATYVNSYMSTAAELSILINSGKYPLQYKIEDNMSVYSDITEKQVTYFAIIVAAILVIMFIINIIKYRTNGMLASIATVGFVSILSLLIRYSNVNISIEGIGAVILTLIINMIIVQKMLEKVKKGLNVREAVVEVYKKELLKLLPIIIITLVFCFAGWANLISFGLIMFWGLTVILAYNTLVTKTLLKLKESK